MTSLTKIRTGSFFVCVTGTQSVLNKCVLIIRAGAVWELSYDFFFLIHFRAAWCVYGISFQKYKRSFLGEDSSWKSWKIAVSYEEKLWAIGVLTHFCSSFTLHTKPSSSTADRNHVSLAQESNYMILFFQSRYSIHWPLPEASYECVNWLKISVIPPNHCRKAQREGKIGWYILASKGSFWESKNRGIFLITNEIGG